MLVLSRKVGQQLIINGNITVVVSHISRSRVALGIQAPRDVVVLRGELQAVEGDFGDLPDEPEAPAVSPIVGDARDKNGRPAP